MKKHLWMIAFVVVCQSVELGAQAVKSFSSSAYIEPFRLEVGYNKTTHLVFPFSIISIDRGSVGILAQKASGVDNILKVKADQKGFEETNLSVITSDGKLYSFLVGYNANPAYLNINVKDSTMSLFTKESKREATFVINDAVLAHYAKEALKAEKNIRRARSKKAGISLICEGFYVKESLLFLRLRLQNHSSINFDTDQLRLYIRDRVQRKRTSIQEQEILPLYILGDTASVKANSTRTIVISVSKFTIPDEKLLVIELMEKGGGRHLFLRLKNKHILKSKPLD